MEDASFHEVAEMLDGQVHTQEFSVEGAVPCLSWLQLLREVGNWAPIVPNTLLENSPYSRVRGIRDDARGGVRHGVKKEGGLG